MFIADKITAYTDYVYNLDRLTVYVSDKPELDYAGLSTQTKCGLVTRKNTALFNPRLHFDCPEPIKASALIASLKSFILCYPL